ncbi:MAG: hypothetical protein IID43_01300 [Planctomycetes bacterium]|nr:hypothetical protein [Planctomycetota bacterium]
MDLRVRRGIFGRASLPMIRLPWHEAGCAPLLSSSALRTTTTVLSGPDASGLKSSGTPRKSIS